MEWHIRNDSAAQVWAAILLWNPDSCADAGSWEARGWYAIPPDGDAYVADTNNRYAYFYAESADGTVWAGPYGDVYVTQRAFDRCLNIGDTNSSVVHMAEAVVDANVHYTHLTDG